MKTRNLSRTLGALMLLAGTALSAPISITVSSNGGPRYADSIGGLLPAGSVIRIGQFDLSAPGSLTLLQTSNDYLALDALFTPLAESLLNAGTVNEAGAPGQQIVINDMFAAGDVFGQITNIEDTYFAFTTPLYAWVFNSSNPAAATQWGIFTATNGWGFPTNPGSETLATFEVDTVVRGANTGAFLELAQVPEPGTILLVVTGVGLLAFRMRRPRAAAALC